MTPTQRQTRQRQLILEELERLRTHPTAAELHESVRRRMPRISLGTVYRNLDRLVRQGIVRRLESRGGQARFDADRSPHFHIHCVQCGAVSDIHDSLPLENARRLRAAMQGHDHEVLGVRMEIEGICPACRPSVSDEELEHLRRVWH